MASAPKGSPPAGGDLLECLTAEAASEGVAFRARRSHLHHTWAKTFSSLPELYVQPESQAEVEAVVRLARRHRRRVALVGCGHSPSELTCTSSWLVNLDRLGRVLAVDVAARTITVQAGIRLAALGDALDAHGLAMANLGSINEQSLAGALATGTHGSSLRHGLLSEDVASLRITLADGTTRFCSAGDADRDGQELFRAALLSLGALGIVTEITFRAVPAFRLRWRQTIDADAKMLAAWREGTLWSQAHFVRVWWLPYTRRAVVWAAQEAGDDEPDRAPPASYYDGRLGYLVYHNLLALARWLPPVLPWVEWFVFGMQYGFGAGAATATGAVQPSRQALLMNCLYSQYVNEWAIPLERGPEALTRLGAWLNRLRPGDAGYVEHGIPFSAGGLYVHAPVEVRVADTSLASSGPRPFLDPTVPDGPTLYLNAIMYRPYHADPPGVARYYEAFEWLMRDLGGRPHWAKNFAASAADLEALYDARGDDGLRRWRAVRAAVDPEGMFVGAWHRRHVLGDAVPRLPLEEAEVGRRRAAGWGDDVRVIGAVAGEA